MASAAQSVRLCFRRCCVVQPSLKPTTSMGRATAATTATQSRFLSTTSVQRYAATPDDGNETGKDQPLEAWEQEMMNKEAASERIMSITDAVAATLSSEERTKLPRASHQDLEREARMLVEMRREFALGRRSTPKKRNMFWNEEEADAEMITDEVGEDEFKGDDITSMAHGKLEEMRERRHYARLAAWEMPLLSKLARPFEPPALDMPLRFRFTSYMGEFHPAERKVVVEFCPADLDLSEVQQSKLKKLVGPRYNPETEIVRMSCEQFEHQAQNKRYLGDMVEKLIAEAKDPADTFEDIPLDTRHHTFKTKPRFPKEWRLTEERRKELQELRAQAFLREQKKISEGTLVHGAQRVVATLAPPTKSNDLSSDQMAELVHASPLNGPSTVQR